MNSPTSNLSSSLSKTGSGFVIYVVSPETKEIITYQISHFDATFKDVIDNLKKLGKPSNIFYYNGDTTQIKPSDKVSSYLPTRQSQVIFWASSGQLEFPIIQHKKNNILVLMITPDYQMLSFGVPGSTDINQLIPDYRPLVKLANGNQTKITSGTLSENLPIRSNQIVFLLGEKEIVSQSSRTSIINLIRTENIPMAGPIAYTTRHRNTLGNKVAAVMESNIRNPNHIQYIDVSSMSSSGTGTRKYWAYDSGPGFAPKLAQNRQVSKTFPIAYTTQDQYKAALKMMGLTDYYP